MRKAKHTPDPDPRHHMEYYVHAKSYHYTLVYNTCFLDVWIYLGGSEIQMGPYVRRIHILHIYVKVKWRIETKNGKKITDGWMRLFSLDPLNRIGNLSWEWEWKRIHIYIYTVRLQTYCVLCIVANYVISIVVCIRIKSKTWWTFIDAEGELLVRLMLRNVILNKRTREEFPSFKFAWM